MVGFPVGAEKRASASIALEMFVHRLVPIAVILGSGFVTCRAVRRHHNYVLVQTALVTSNWRGWTSRGRTTILVGFFIRLTRLSPAGNLRVAERVLLKLRVQPLLSMTADHWHRRRRFRVLLLGPLQLVIAVACRWNVCALSLVCWQLVRSSIWLAF